MNKKMSFTSGSQKLDFFIPEENYCYYIEPKNIKQKKNDLFYIKKAFYQPIDALPLDQVLQKQKKILLIVDDITRPTPKKRLLPLILRELEKLGIKPKNITILIALGTHRYMTDHEINDTFGEEIKNSYHICNHEWDNPDNLVHIGKTQNNIDIIINKKIIEADFSIGIGSIVPHSEAGWSGGGKIVQPGICGWVTTGATHLMAAKNPLYLEIAGTINNKVRKEIEYISEKVGLNYIINFILGMNEQIYNVVSGHPITAHRHGVNYAKNIFEIPIDKLADIVIVNAYPADLDYWQGDKPITYSLRGLKEKGILILVGRFTEGISSTHPTLEKYGHLNYKELVKLYSKGTIKDEVALAALFIHAHHKKKASIICVSSGITKEQKKYFGFIHAETIQNAINIALKVKGKNAKIGVINYGGDLLPVFSK